MNSSIRFLNRFFRYILTGQRRYSRPRDIIPIEEFNLIEASSKTSVKDSQDHVPSREQIRGQLILSINKLLLLICAISFVAVIVYPFIYPDKAVPDIIQNAFFTTLGWFGGALGTFFQTEKNEGNGQNG
jgi:hypothetical protein